MQGVQLSPSSYDDLLGPDARPYFLLRDPQRGHCLLRTRGKCQFGLSFSRIEQWFWSPDGDTYFLLHRWPTGGRHYMGASTWEMNDMRWVSEKHLVEVSIKVEACCEWPDAGNPPALGAVTARVQVADSEERRYVHVPADPDLLKRATLMVPDTNYWYISKVAHSEDGDTLLVLHPGAHSDRPWICCFGQIAHEELFTAPEARFFVYTDGGTFAAEYGQNKLVLPQSWHQRDGELRMGDVSWKLSIADPGQFKDFLHLIPRDRFPRVFATHSEVKPMIVPFE